ncbi:MAG TPA: histidine kinase dimerization/phospho-acceptor domain-containing protein, partial [Allosphingosinicella sp.]|nr:histidine kinase dimerization/phospho-acceptor domain-containing protein [Allosphingosinicella sp.]
MAANRTTRILAAAAAAMLGLVLALIMGAPFAGALVALLGGALAHLFLAQPGNGPVAADEPAEPAGLPPLPDASELLGAVDQPLLIVKGRRVLLANAAAKEVLGPHIEGVDVRLAIRHPAAAERLAERAPGEPAEQVTRTELVGLGERERRWEMTTSLLPGGSRLVRLTDRSEAFASEQMRGDFVANASHELRTPLATLLGFLETLQDEEAASDRKTRTRFIQIMFEEARRMQRLIDDLISLSRIEAERFTVPKEAVDLLPLVDEVRRSCGRMIEEKKSEILVEDGGGATVTLGDRPQLLQLLNNLIVNALKYGRAGTPVVVRFAEAGSEMLRMSIIDRGEGIAPDHLPRLTERFYRVDPGRS